MGWDLGLDRRLDVAWAFDSIIVLCSALHECFDFHDEDESCKVILPALCNL